MTRQEFDEAWENFTNSLSYDKDEWYCSEREISVELGEKFVNYFWADDFAKEERYKQYLQLKEEFEK